MNFQVENQQIEVLATSSGRRDLIVGNYRYRMTQVRKNKPVAYIGWRCVNDKVCTAKCKTDLSATVLLSQPTEHTHTPEMDVQMMTTKSSIVAEALAAQRIVHVVGKESARHSKEITPVSAKRGRGRPPKAKEKKTPISKGGKDQLLKLTTDQHDASNKRKINRPLKYTDYEEDVTDSKQKRGRAAQNKDNYNSLATLTKTSKRKHKNQIDANESTGADRRPELVVIQIRQGEFRIYIKNGEMVDDWEILREKDAPSVLPHDDGGALYYAVSILPRKICVDIAEGGSISSSTSDGLPLQTSRFQESSETEAEKVQSAPNPVNDEWRSMQEVFVIGPDITGQALNNDSVDIAYDHDVNNCVIADNEDDTRDDFEESTLTPSPPTNDDKQEEEAATFATAALTRASIFHSPQRESQMLSTASISNQHKDDSEPGACYKAKSQALVTASLPDKKMNGSKAVVCTQRLNTTSKIVSTASRNTIHFKEDVGPQTKSQTQYTNLMLDRDKEMDKSLSGICSKKFTASAQNKTKNDSKTNVHSQKQLSINLTNESLAFPNRKKGYQVLCKICNIQFSTKAEYTQHKNKEHMVDGKFPCRHCDCGRSFRSFHNYVQHVNRVLGVKPLSCDMCGMQLANKSTLYKHMFRHLDSLRYHCKLCSFSSNFRKPLEHHQIIHTTERPFKCEICPATFNNPLNLRRHKVAHSGLRPYKCELCDMAFHQSSHLVQHRRTIHYQDRSVCLVCGKAFTWVTELYKHFTESHVLTGDDIRSLKSSITEKPARQRVVKRGYKVSRQRSVPPPGHHPCHLCDQKFERAQELGNHLRYVHKAGHLCSSFLCDICGKGFSSNDNMIQHRSIHTGEKEYVCNVCGETCFNRNALKRHQASAHNIKNYQCTVCNKRFISHNALQVHKRIHTGERPYVCDICGKAFIQSCHFKEHWTKVHKLEHRQIIYKRKSTGKAAQHQDVADGEDIQHSNADRQSIQYHDITRGQTVQHPNVDGQASQQHDDHGIGSAQSVQHHQAIQHDQGWAGNTEIIQPLISEEFSIQTDQGLLRLSMQSSSATHISEELVGTGCVE